MQTEALYEKLSHASRPRNVFPTLVALCFQVLIKSVDIDLEILNRIVP